MGLMSALKTFFGGGSASKEGAEVRVINRDATAVRPAQPSGVGSARSGGVPGVQAAARPVVSGSVEAKPEPVRAAAGVGGSSEGARAASGVSRGVEEAGAGDGPGDAMGDVGAGGGTGGVAERGVEGSIGERAGLAPVRSEPTANEIEAARIAELREQYEKVLNLVEKVDRHLDQQEARSQKIMAIVEKFPAEALQKLEGLGANQAALNKSISSVHQTVTDSMGSLQTSLGGLQTSLGGMETSLGGMQSAFGELARSTDNLGELLTAMKQRDEDRDARLQTHMEHTQRHNEVMQKWMIIMLVLGALGVSAAIVVAVFVVLSPGGVLGAAGGAGLLV